MTRRKTRNRFHPSRGTGTPPEEICAGESPSGLHLSKSDIKATEGLCLESRETVASGAYVPMGSEEMIKHLHPCKESPPPVRSRRDPFTGTNFVSELAKS